MLTELQLITLCGYTVFILNVYEYEVLLFKATFIIIGS